MDLATGCTVLLTTSQRVPGTKSWRPQGLGRHLLRAAVVVGPEPEVASVMGPECRDLRLVEVGPATGPEGGRGLACTGEEALGPPPPVLPPWGLLGISCAGRTAKGPGACRKALTLCGYSPWGAEQGPSNSRGRWRAL